MGRFKNRTVKPNLSRPSVDLTPTAREWRNVSVQDLREDDIVAGKGIVQAIHQMQDPTKVAFSAGHPESRLYIFDADKVVYAFVKRG